MGLLKLVNRLRRKFMISFIDKDYVNKKISKRKGSCKKCGSCCLNCRYLYIGDNKNISNKKNEIRLCKIYDNEKIPWFCHRQFPIDEFDKKVFLGKNKNNCGYFFEK